MEIGITPSSRTQQFFRRVDDSWFIYFVTVPLGKPCERGWLGVHLWPLSYNCIMDLLVYSDTWCPDCRTAKRFLEKHNISYKEINIESTPGAAEEVIRQTGKRAIPQFVIDGRWVQPYRPGEGFLYEEMSALLGLVDEG